MKKHVALLQSLSASNSVVEWASQFESLEKAWFKCEESDWMIWLLQHLNVDITDQEWRLLACDFAEDSLQYVNEEHAETRAVCEGVIEVARRFAFGDATQEELNDAAYAAAAASYAAASPFNYGWYYLRPHTTLHRWCRWVLSGMPLDTNPCTPLIELYRLGCTPIGCATGEFVVYCPPFEVP